MQPAQERSYIRGLAERVAAIAADPENERVKRRWRDVNALRKPDRPPVWCRPVGAWDELLPEASLRCADPRLRSLEREFRQTLIKHEIGDDSPVEPYVGVPAVFDVEPENVWGLEVKRRSPEIPGGAWAYEPPLRIEADFDHLKLPKFTYNVAKTGQELEYRHDLLDDILPPRLVCHAPLTATLGYIAADLRGLNNVMADMMEAPTLMHRLMAHLRDGVLRAMDQVEASGLLTANNIGPMTCSDPIGPEPVDGNLTFSNLWVSANSQEFDGVSPAMWEEFCLEYQRPILDRFGLVCYGCCENLTDKIDGVLSIANLRIFVCSAWTDLEKVVERVGANYVIMWRQKASDVVFSEDLNSLRRHLEEGLRRLRGCRVQIVLRELQTLAGNLDRLHLWSRLAKEAAAKHG